MLKAPILVPKTNKLEVRKIKDALYIERASLRKLMLSGKEQFYCGPSVQMGSSFYPVCTQMFI